MITADDSLLEKANIANLQEKIMMTNVVANVQEWANELCFSELRELQHVNKQSYGILSMAYQETEYDGSHILIVWDIENQAPSNFLEEADSLLMAVERKFPGIVVHIKAYGNPEMLSWAMSHPPPAFILLISSDGDFTCSMIALKNLGYTTMLAYDPDSVYDLLRQEVNYSFEMRVIVWDSRLLESLRKIWHEQRCLPDTNRKRKHPILGYGQYSITTENPVW
ncbi:chromo domain protein LHP1 [Tanacetum coccineum]